MLRLLEGFDFYGTSGRTGSGLDTDIEKRHEGGSILYGTDGQLITGRGGDGLALEFNYDSNNKVYLSRYEPGESDTIIMGFAFKTPPNYSTSGFSHKVFEFVYSHLILYWTQGGLYLDNGDWTTAIPLGYAVKPNRWYHFEFKIYFHSTLGTLEVRVNGQTLYSDTNIDTLYSSQPHNLITLFAPEDNSGFDDLYICDGTGSDNNDFLGPVKVEVLRPTGDDGTQNWTPSTGVDHYALVDNNSMWDQTDYVEASGANIDDLWTYSDISKITGAIYGVQLITSAWTDVGLPLILQSICDSGSTVDYSPSKGIGADTLSATQEMIWETDPDTANAWTANGVNGASFGVRKV